MSITWEEMKIKYPEGRNTMSEEREKTYVNECFNCYEQEGFAKKFWSPFSDYKEHFGQSFEVIDEVSTPMWCIAPMDVVSKPEHSSGNTISERCHRCL